MNVVKTLFVGLADFFFVFFSGKNLKILMHFDFFLRAIAVPDCIHGQKKHDNHTFPDIFTLLCELYDYQFYMKLKNLKNA